MMFNMPRDPGRAPDAVERYNKSLEEADAQKRAQCAWLQQKANTGLKAAMKQMQDVARQAPRLWAGAEAKEAWLAKRDQAEARADQMARRSDRIAAITKAVTLSGVDRLREFAIKKVRHQNPELARERDQLVVAQRKAVIQQSLQLQQERRQGHSLSR